MAVDIYCGPLTRYYLGLWENQVQKFCRENGKKYNSISPQENSDSTQHEEDQSPSQQETCETVKCWLNKVSQDIKHDLKWEEGVDIPYFTSRFSEFSEVYALNCYAYHSQACLPRDFPDSLDVSKDPVIKAVEKEGLFCFFGAIEFYIPIILPENKVFEIELPNERGVFCSSTQTLLEELDKLTHKIWNISMSDLDNLSEEEIIESYSFGKEYLILAIYGLCKLYKNALFSQKNNLPILLDY